MRTIFLLAALALAGCGSEGYGSSRSYGATDDDAAGLLLEGGAAFLNGYNQGRAAQQPRMSVCDWNGGVMICTGQ
jgi:hypothetical protein